MTSTDLMIEPGLIRVRRRDFQGVGRAEYTDLFRITVVEARALAHELARAADEAELAERDEAAKRLVAAREKLAAAQSEVARLESLAAAPAPAKSKTAEWLLPAGVGL